MADKKKNARQDEAGWVAVRIPVELRTRAKVLAARRRVRLQDVLAEALTEYLKHNNA